MNKKSKSKKKTSYILFIFLLFITLIKANGALIIAGEALLEEAPQMLIAAGAAIAATGAAIYAKYAEFIGSEIINEAPPKPLINPWDISDITGGPISITVEKDKERFIEDVRRRLPDTLTIQPPKSIPVPCEKPIPMPNPKQPQPNLPDCYIDKNFLQENIQISQQSYPRLQDIYQNIRPPELVRTNKQDFAQFQQMQMESDAMSANLAGMFALTAINLIGGIANAKRAENVPTGPPVNIRIFETNTEIPSNIKNILRNYSPEQFRDQMIAQYRKGGYGTFEQFLHRQFCLYQFEGFRGLLLQTRGFEDFIRELHRQFWKCGKQSENLREQFKEIDGLKKHRDFEKKVQEFVNYFDMQREQQRQQILQELNRKKEIRKQWQEEQTINPFPDFNNLILENALKSTINQISTKTVFPTDKELFPTTDISKIENPLIQTLMYQNLDLLNETNKLAEAYKDSQAIENISYLSQNIGNYLKNYLPKQESLQKQILLSKFNNSLLDTSKNFASIICKNNDNKKPLEAADLQNLFNSYETASNLLHQILKEKYKSLTDFKDINLSDENFYQSSNINVIQKLIENSLENNSNYLSLNSKLLKEQEFLNDAKNPANDYAKKMLTPIKTIVCDAIAKTKNYLEYEDKCKKFMENYQQWQDDRKTLIEQTKTNYFQNALSAIKNITNNNFKIDDKIAPVFQHNNIDLATFESFSGDATQNKIHKQLIDNLNKAATPYFIYSDNLNIQHISDLICKLANEAQNANINKNYKQAENILTMMNLMIKAQDKYCEVIDNYADVSIKALGENIPVIIKNTVAGNIPLNKDFNALYLPLVLKLSEMSIPKLEKPEQKARLKTLFLNGLSQESVTEICEAIFTEPNKEQLKILSGEIWKIINEEKNLENSISSKDKKLLEIISPLKTIFESTAKILQKAANEESKYLPKVLEKIQNKTDLINPAQSIAENISKIYEQEALAAEGYKPDQNAAKEVIAANKNKFDQEMSKNNLRLSWFSDNKPVYLKIMKNDFIQVMQSKTSSDYDKQLASIGYESTKECLNEDDDDPLPTPDKTYDRNFKRAETSFATLNLDSCKQAKTSYYDLNDHSKKYLNEANFDSYDFTKFTGDSIQRLLHSEIVDNLNDTSAIYNDHQDLLPVRHLTYLMYMASNQAIFCNKEKDVENCYELTNYSRALNKQIRFTTGILTSGIDLRLAIAKGLGKGALNAANPIAAIKAPFDLIWLALKGIGYGTYYSYKGIKYYNDHDSKEFTTEFNRRNKALIDKLGKISTNFYEYYKEHPYEAVELASEFIGDAILRRKINPKFSNFLEKDKIKRIISVEAKIAKDISDPTIRKIATPAFEAARETIDAFKTLEHHDPKKVVEACEVIKKNTFLLENEKPAEIIEALVGKHDPSKLAAFTETAKIAANGEKTLLVESLEKFGPKFPTRHTNWKHPFLVEEGLKKGKLSIQGFHYKASMPNSIIELVKTPNKFGVYEAYFEYKGIKKFSTFFPDDWPHKKVIQKIKEAYHNPIILTKQNGFVGQTEEGVFIQFWFKKNENTKNIILNSVYPYHAITLEELEELLWKY
ncbi:TPA: hypothetical protein DEO28_01740 [Candidatus Dependentiae bacterium]|nr:MAG: hypothetical protein UR14_C0004G0038 [candidate division TM6 bacterium GW2011_GWE2_31_21]KKP52956.1 MAG: hypothetical protein UR43_C0008G0038 [candidate division TM6 bacterium GW2011_GWF2_33_332]HBS47806.1 hypothetical protein [Candidatus Dependentiae bacterium]HBZ73218.1 hypothetical protein [Candidatus Dependentiae bacterium]